MFSFKLSNGKIVEYAEIDGYMIAGLVLDGISIRIYVEHTGKITASIKESDKKLLEGIDYKDYLIEAEKIAKGYIKNRELDLFLTSELEYVVDIVNSNNQSYYHKMIPPVKEVIHIKIRPLCSEAILERIENKKTTLFDKNIN